MSEIPANTHVTIEVLGELKSRVSAYLTSGNPGDVIRTDDLFELIDALVDDLAHQFASDEPEPASSEPAFENVEAIVDTAIKTWSDAVSPGRLSTAITRAVVDFIQPGDRQHRVS